MSKKNRKHLRYNPDPLDFALISFDSRKNVSEFAPTETGLLLQESYGGAGMVVKKVHDYKVGEFIWVKVGQLAPMYAEVRWIKELDDYLLRIGLQYYEAN